MRVLIVDDESLIRMDLRDIIESCGHEVVAEGTNGVEAIQLCKQHKPDIILMDVKMLLGRLAFTTKHLLCC